MDDSEINKDTKSPSDITDELNSINRSLTENFAGIVAIALSTYSYYIKRQGLLCSVNYEPCCDDLPNNYGYRLAAYIIALGIAISDFSTESDSLKDTAVSCKTRISNEMSYWSALLVLIAAIIDILNILLTGQESQPPFF